MTDLRIGQTGRGLGPRATLSYDDSLLTAQLLRGIISQFTLKRVKMQTSTFHQHRNNTIILFATQYKNDNTAFHRSSAMSGGFALL